MTRWRILNIILSLIAVAGLFMFTGRDWSSLAAGEFSHTASEGSMPFLVDKALDEMPGWVSSVATFVTLFVFGAANLYLFPARVRKMQAELTVSWARTFQIILAGLAFGLLFALAAMMASLSRVTFPLTVLLGLGLFTLSLWGYLSLTYGLGRLLFQKAEWRLSPFGALALGLLLLHSLIHVPFVGFVFGLLGSGAGLGIVITTRFGSLQPWDLNLLLED
jgi:hypothetical protein